MLEVVPIVADVNHSKHRRPRRRGKRPRSDQPSGSPAVAIIEKSKPPVDTSKPADVPLTAEEAAEMRVHFRFLKEHRKLLDLKPNAAEDLLLNGAREPTHRGICQHLLAKVERRRVELAVQRIDVGSRMRLLEGIIRFSSDIAYLLLYLESLRDASRPEAPAALSAALRHIDFAQVSAAQMRRVLDLVVELVAPPDRPQVLFGLLQSTTFQAAFDKSADSLPEPLAEIVIPLRAAHTVIVRGGANRENPETLARGVGMLLTAHEKVLRAQTLPVRQRLFEFGIELCREPARRFAPGLKTLVESFPKEERSHSESAMRLARWLLSVELDDEARALLGMLRRDHPSFRLPSRLLDALDGERFGRIGLTERRSDSGRGPVYISGVLLDRQTPVWVRIGAPDEAERFRRALEIARTIAIPSVADVVASGTSARGEPYLAIRRLGRGANEVILGKTGLPRTDAISIAAESVRILAALAQSGVKLPDARFRRFAVDDAARLWLRDWLDAELTGVDVAVGAHAELARELCLDVLGRSDRVVLGETRLNAIRAATDCVAIVRVLEELG